MGEIPSSETVLYNLIHHPVTGVLYKYRFNSTVIVHSFFFTPKISRFFSLFSYLPKFEIALSDARSSSLIIMGFYSVKLNAYVGNDCSELYCTLNLCSLSSVLQWYLACCHPIVSFDIVLLYVYHVNFHRHHHYCRHQHLQPTFPPIPLMVVKSNLCLSVSISNSWSDILYFDK